MRVLQMASAFAYTGPAAPMLSLAADLKAHGHDVTVAHDTVRPQGNVHEEAIAPHVKASGLRVAGELSLCTRSGPISWLRDIARLRKALVSYDVIHAHLSHDHAVAAAARGGARTPRLVRSIHSERSLRERPGQAMLLRRADALVVHSRADAELLAGRFHLKSVHVVRGAVDIARFHVEERQKRAAAFRARHHLPDGPALAMVAIFQPGRGQREVLAAWPAVRAAIPGAQLWFVGLGEERDAVMAQASRVEGVHFLGYLTDELPDAYAAADASLLLAIGNDGFGRAALESLACGTPIVVGSGLAPVVEVVQDRGTGRIIDGTGGEAIAAGIVSALNTPKDAARCRQVVLEGHTQAKVTSEVLAIYRGLGLR